MLLWISRIFRLGLVLGCLYIGGFFWFVSYLARPDTNILIHEDQSIGIVSPTGGPGRLRAGFELLQKGFGQRLLISGINSDTNTDQTMRSRYPDYDALFDCCVDLEYTAPDTVGNARSAALWVLKHKFDSVVLVTSDFHIPRAVVEFRRALPGDVTVVPYWVLDINGYRPQWWQDREHSRLVFLEYSKFIAALLRERLGVLYGAG